MSPRSMLVAALLLVCAFVATASAVDTSFGSASLQADSWPSLSQDAHAVAADVLARHQEFLFAELGATGDDVSSTGPTDGVDSSSSTGVESSSSSSTGAAPYNVTTYAPATVKFNLEFNRTTVPATLDEDFANATAAATRHPRDLINAAHIFVNVLPKALRRRSAMVRFMRKANADGTEEVTQMILTITPLNNTDSSASVFAKVISAQLSCTDSPTQTKEQCAAQVAQANGLDATAPTIFDSPAVVALAAAIDTESFVTEDGVTIELIDPSADNGHLIPSSGTARDTNIGYYVLGAVLAVFVAAALVFFIAHKAPVAKEEPVLVERRAPAVALEEIPRSAAPADAVAVPVAEPVAEPAAADAAAASSGVQTVEEPAAGQMDYKSVFALKHNVLDKKDDADATAAAPADDNDVHFVLHQ